MYLFYTYLLYTLHRCLEHVPIVLSFLRVSLSLYPCLQFFLSNDQIIFNGGTIENERNKIKKLNDIKLVSSI